MKNLAEINAIVAGLRKDFGAGAVTTLDSDSVLQVDVIPTGSLAVDIALGVGGIPRGRVTEIYGPECIDENSFVSFETRKNGRRINQKGGTISRLFELFHGTAAGNRDRRGKRDLADRTGYEYFVPAMSETGRIVKAKLDGVVDAGEKECFEVVTQNGLSLVASAAHEFWTGDEFKKLGTLYPGETVFMHTNTPFRKAHQIDGNRERAFLFVHYHPVAAQKIVRVVHNRTTGVKRNYRYHRLRLSRAVVEAALNALSLEEYTKRLNVGDLRGLSFLARDQHVHHLDGSVKNNALENLQVLSAKAHGHLHAMERQDNLRFIITPQRIAAIRRVGRRKTFDLQVAAPYHNYVANGFIVHNSGGKTTLTLQVIANAQKAGGIAAFIDAEHALDPAYARALGVNTEELIVSQPDNGEQALEILDAIISTGKVAIAVVDSVAALVPKSELEGEMGDAQMGLQARLMSQAMRKLVGVTGRTNTAVIFINQIREKLGVIFGSPETTSGGRALKFFSSVRIDVRRIQTLKAGDEKSGNRVRVRIVKNKVAAPFKEAEVDLFFGQGFSLESDLIELGVKHELIERSGSWFSFGGESIGQGAEKVRDFLRENPAVRDRIEMQLREKLLPKKLKEAA